MPSKSSSRNNSSKASPKASPSPTPDPTPLSSTSNTSAAQSKVDSASSLTARRMSNSTSTTPPLSLNIPDKQVPLKSNLSLRDAQAPSLNATASPLPSDSSNGNTPPPLTTSGAQRVGRSGTVKKSGGKRSSSKQPPTAGRRDSEGGYEAGPERHGQSNDFVDPEDSDDTSAKKTGSGGGGKGSEPTTNEEKSTDSKGLKVTDYVEEPPKQNLTPAEKHYAIKNSLPANFPDPESMARSMLRNRNPSTSSHQHPSRLPYGRSPKSHGGKSTRSPSMSSMRSVDATNHPFPTPGLKQSNQEFIFDDFKSVEERRLDEDERKEKHWKRWGPYLSERQWVSRNSFTSSVPTRKLTRVILTGYCS